MLEQTGVHKDLKFVPPFLTIRREESRNISRDIDDWMDKHQIQTYLNYPPAQLEEYISHLDSRPHRNPICRKLQPPLLEYHFIWSSCVETETSDSTRKELTAAAQKRSMQKVQAIGDGTFTSSKPNSSQKGKGEEEVTVLASAEWTQMQVGLKACILEHKAATKAMHECSLLLSQLKRSTQETCKEAYQLYKQKYEQVEQLLSVSLDLIGQAKAIPPEDVSQSEEVLTRIKTTRGLLYTSQSGIREAKKAVTKLLSTA